MTARLTLQRTWRRGSGRIDALSGRERLVLFVALAAAMLAAFDVTVLSPQSKATKAQDARVRAQAGELEVLRRQVALGDVADDSPAGRLQRELRDTRSALQAVDAEIAAQRTVTTAAMPARLDTLMARVLRRHERLVLLKLVSSGDAAQTVDFAVRGAYLELLAYVDALEHELPGLRWETLSLGARGADTELQARVALPGSVR